MVLARSVTRRMRISGTTTADDVPPRIIPISNAVSGSIGNRKSAMKKTSSTVNANVAIEMTSVSRADFLRSFMLR